MQCKFLISFEPWNLQCLSLATALCIVRQVRSLRRHLGKHCHHPISFLAYRRSVHWNHPESNYEQCFPVLLFIKRYKVVLSFESLHEIPRCGHLNENNCEQCFSVVLFIKRYKVVLSFESLHEIPRCGHLNENNCEQCFPVVLFVMFQERVCNFLVSVVEKGRRCMWPFAIEPLYLVLLLRSTRCGALQGAVDLRFKSYSVTLTWKLLISPSVVSCCKR